MCNRIKYTMRRKCINRKIFLGDIGIFRQRKQAHGGGLLEKFLWHSRCQNNRISSM